MSGHSTPIAHSQTHLLPDSSKRIVAQNVATVNERGSLSRTQHQQHTISARKSNNCSNQTDCKTITPSRMTLSHLAARMYRNFHCRRIRSWYVLLHWIQTDYRYHHTSPRLLWFRVQLSCMLLHFHLRECLQVASELLARSRTTRKQEDMRYRTVVWCVMDMVERVSIANACPQDRWLVGSVVNGSNISGANVIVKDR